MTDQPIVIAKNKRPFPAYPAAIQSIIINDKAEVLLLSSPTRNAPNEWQVMSGGMEANETFLEGAIREAHEEAGAGLEIRPLGVVHAQTFTYDEGIPYMMSVHYLFDYLGGKVEPGDDMAGSQYRWWSLAALKAANATFHPSTSHWLLERAVELWRLWHENPPSLETLQHPELK